MRRILVIAGLIAAACTGERAPEAQREQLPADSAGADSMLTRGDSMMARDTATPG